METEGGLYLGSPEAMTKTSTLGELQDELNMLGETLGLLEDRLSPILGPIDPEPSRPDHQSLDVLHTAVRAKTIKLRELRSALDRIIARIEL